MKTLRISSLIAVAVVAASAAVAGPGPEYWQNHQRNSAAKATKPADAAAVVQSAKCTTMTTQNGKVTVSCTGAVAKSAECKAACGK